MDKKQKFYLTTAIPYVNGRPHVGHALEYVIADAIHRYYEMKGNDTRIISGADENALKNVQAAEKAGKGVKEFLDEHSKIFEGFYNKLGVELDEFRRGTDQEKHWPGVQKLWKLAHENGDIYKKAYTGLYCVGCEAFVDKSELVDGKCPDHDKEPEVVEEENYFFRLSKYQDELRDLIGSNQYKIYPEKRKREVLAFIDSGLRDFSISRSNARASGGIGVPVPGDDTQKIYVWFDALAIYMTGTGYGYDNKLWEKYWPADLHVIGKDIFRFHAIYWPAMLLSAKLPLPKELLVHGFIDSGGRKMSKSLGNVVDPYEVMDLFGLEPLRYYLLSQIPTLDDGDFTVERFREVYQADLANGLGNLVSRVAAMAEKSGLSFRTLSASIDKGVSGHIENYNLNLALGTIWDKIRKADEFISKEKVWSLGGSKQKDALERLVTDIRQIAVDLKPFLPITTEKIEKQFAGDKIKTGDPLFPRLS